MLQVLHVIREVNIARIAGAVRRDPTRTGDVVGKGRARTARSITHFQAVLLLSLLTVVGVFAPQDTFANPIYVFKESDGSIRFTNRAPPPGIRAQVFTGRSSQVSYYRYNTRGRRSRLFQHEFGDVIQNVAAEQNLDPHLIRAVIHVESAFNPRAVSPKGARGLMQLMPGTARGLGVSNSFHPSENIRGGSRHLARLLKKYQGNTRYALAAYNAGEEAVRRYGGIPPYQETVQYVHRVLELKERYRASSAV